MTQQTPENMESVMRDLNNAERAVERAQQQKTGYMEAQNFVKQAEDTLNRAKHNPSINSTTNEKQMKKADDLLRLIMETNNAINRQ